jgi:hydrogenase expression/formation protein HypC
MCLGIPGRLMEVVQISPVRMGRVSFEGVSRNVCLEYVPEAVPGDYLLVHVGFALTRIDEAEAQRVFELLAELPLLDERREGSGHDERGEAT